MPQYEFVCCRKQFSKILTLAEYKQHTVKRPTSEVTE